MDRQHPTQRRGRRGPAGGHASALRLPIGWPGWPLQSSTYHGTDSRTPHHPGDWWLKTLGLIITALAAMQGGPFWFDLLGKLINLRLTGPPPAKTGQANQAQP